MKQSPKIKVVGMYEGREQWVIGLFPADQRDPFGAYRIGVPYGDGVTFLERPFTNREDAEAFLLFNVDTTAKI